MWLPAGDQKGASSFTFRHLQLPVVLLENPLRQKGLNRVIESRGDEFAGPIETECKARLIDEIGAVLGAYDLRSEHEAGLELLELYPTDRSRARGSGATGNRPSVRIADKAVILGSVGRRIS